MTKKKEIKKTKNVEPATTSNIPKEEYFVCIWTDSCSKEIHRFETMEDLVSAALKDWECDYNNLEDFLSDSDSNIILKIKGKTIQRLSGFELGCPTFTCEFE